MTKVRLSLCFSPSEDHISCVLCPVRSIFTATLLVLLCSGSGRYGNEPQLVKAGSCSNLNGQVQLVIQGRMLAQGGEGALECHTAVLISC